MICTGPRQLRVSEATFRHSTLRQPCVTAINLNNMPNSINLTRKTIGGIGRMKYGDREKVAWTFTVAAAAYNLVRIPKPMGGDMSASAGCHLLGRWRIIEADIWDRDYLYLVQPADHLRQERTWRVRLRRNSSHNQTRICSTDHLLQLDRLRRRRRSVRLRRPWRPRRPRNRAMLTQR